MNGYGARRRRRPNDRTKIIPAGKQVDGFAQLKDDGSTACGCWIYSGCWTEKGNMMARRDNTDPGDRGIAPNWAFAWPANRRVLYNRASCDPEGKPVGRRSASSSSGTASSGSASTCRTTASPSNPR
jgi:hypothetical protein